jgi:uncharacterized protein YndB with AHSA1/START domain
MHAGWAPPARSPPEGGCGNVETIEKSILIDAPPEKVFAYMNEPEHMLEYWPSMVEVRDATQLPNGGWRYHWIYKMAGVRLEGDSEAVEFEPDKHFVVKNTGQIPSTFDWTFAPENGSTRLTTKVEYEIPDTVLGKLGKPFIVKLNEREAESVLGNLKDRMEA